METSKLETLADEYLAYQAAIRNLRKHGASLTDRIGWTAFYIFMEGDDSSLDELKELIALHGPLNDQKGVVSKARKVAAHFRKHAEIATVSGIAYRKEIMRCSAEIPYFIPITSMYNALIGADGQ